MIDDILDVMEMIVTRLFDIIENLRDFALALFYGFVLLLIVAALPVWIFPYLIWRARKKNDDDSDDDFDPYTVATR